MDIDLLNDDAVILTGLDHCAIGHSTDGVLVYSYSKLIQQFVDDGMTDEEAVEWIDFNIACLTGNGAGFVILIDA